ncbi:hypothetical protein M422DRAFT_242088 [Sphaerobolus stellatus SS14]|nr:hypothetical protein M422DRAFT_242088 [Sphaerobolus stellatus SS14]
MTSYNRKLGTYATVTRVEIKPPEDLKLSATLKIQLVIHPLPSRRLKYRLGTPVPIIDSQTFTAEEIFESSHVTSESLEGFLTSSVAKVMGEIGITIIIYATVTLFSFESMISLPDDLGDIVDAISTLSSALDFIGKGAETLGEGLSFLKHISNIHPAAQAAVMILAIPYTLLKNQQKFVDDMKGLKEEIYSFEELLKALGQTTISDFVRICLADLFKTILGAARFIGEYMMKNLAQRQKIVQLNPQCLQEFTNKLAGLKLNLLTALSSQTTNTLEGLDSSKTLEILEAYLQPAQVKDYPKGCMAGTRSVVLEQLEGWASSATEENILFMSGSPGAGKTAIAVSALKRLADKETVHFFFKRGEKDFRNPSLIWRTLAFQLAQKYKYIADHLRTFFKAKDSSYIHTLEIKEQFQELIVNTLKTSQGRRGKEPLILIIDALDECDSSDREGRKALLETLHLCGELHPYLKMIITAREDRDIITMLQKMEKKVQTLQLYTGPAVDPHTNNDINFFLQTCFEEIRNNYSLSASWPGESAISRLSKYAAGLFIWANLVIDFIQAEETPGPRLDEVLQHMGSYNFGDSEGDNSTSRIDELYGQILYRIFYGLRTLEKRAYQAVLGTILCAQDPLTLNDLRDIIFQIDERFSWDYIQGAIQKARCVLIITDVDNRNQVIRVCHQSFVDFYQGGSRRIENAIHVYARRVNSKNITFQFDMQQQHQDLAYGLLKLMNSNLHFNMCNFPSSFLSNEDVQELDMKISSKVSSSLAYACQYWATHLQESSQRLNQFVNNYPTPSLSDATTVFFTKHLLSWLEILSIKNIVYVATAQLTLASAYFASRSNFITEFARDARNFISIFQEPITRSLPHIYLSALPFIPSSSLTAQYYLPAVQKRFKVVDGQWSEWPQIYCRLKEHTAVVICIAFSPDSQYFVSGSADSTIRVWDVRTGQRIGELLRGHTRSVTCVDISADGAHIVSGSHDGTICVWDIKTGQMTLEEPIQGHADSVTSVAFSPNAHQIISSSDDWTICVWNMKTGNRIGEPFSGHTRSITCVAFSPDGQKITSGSEDRAIFVWDAKEGKRIGEPLHGHEDIVTSVTFSTDGQHIISGSQDKTIFVWDVRTCQKIAELQGHTDGVTSVVIFPNGQHIISSSHDCTIRMWDFKTGQKIGEPLQGHTKSIRCIAISPDGRYIISGSSDTTICVWDVMRDYQTAVNPLQGHVSEVTSVAVSPYGQNYFWN